MSSKDILLYNTKNGKLYEWVNGGISFIAANVKVYDEFAFNNNELINAKAGV